jgi:hypothetical protein
MTLSSHDLGFRGTIHFLGKSCGDFAPFKTTRPGTWTWPTLTHTKIWIHPKTKSPPTMYLNNKLVLLESLEDYVLGDENWIECIYKQLKEHKVETQEWWRLVNVYKGGTLERIIFSNYLTWHIFCKLFAISQVITVNSEQVKYSMSIKCFSFKLNNLMNNFK